jgi:GntR family transcriptional regulator
VSTLPLSLSAASGVPFYRQMTDQIAALIRSGRLPPGTLLPSVRDLAAQLMVSLITARRAYADLEAAGLAVRRQGQGTFVADEVEAAAAERSLAQARALLCDAVRRARLLGLDPEGVEAQVRHVLASEEDPS